MGAYLAALVLLFMGRTICTGWDAPCNTPDGRQVLLPATVGLVDLALISLNVAAGAMLIVRKRWILLPVVLLLIVDPLSLWLLPGNVYALVFTLGLILPAGWVATFVAVTVQVGADSKPRRGGLGSHPGDQVVGGIVVEETDSEHHTE
jgi:hypothetical protein